MTNEKIPVLVLDDEPNVTRLTRMALSMHGYEVTECNTPQKAIDIANEKTFSLVLVDMMMPEISGLEVMQRIKLMETNKQTRFIVLSGKKMAAEEKRIIFDLGAEIVAKPFVPKKLLETVDAMLKS